MQAILETLKANQVIILAPEIWISFSACFILIFDKFFAKLSRWITYLLTQFTLFVALFLTLQLVPYPTTEAFHHSFILDPISNLLKIVIYVYGIFGFIYARKYLWSHKMVMGEYFILCLFSIVGMMILVSSKSFLTLYLGIELLTLPLFALIAMGKEDKFAPEASMKYFVMGAVSSGMLLYGISLLYGATGSFEMAGIAKNIASRSEFPSIAVLTGMVFVFTAVAFKLGAVPFHMWVPDVYQGAPTSVTLFIATLSKLAGFGLAIRVLLDVFPAIYGEWRLILMILAIASLVLGNIVGIAQSNFKRLLAYSTIGHIGFVCLALLTGPESGYAPALAYMIIYAFMALAAFGMIIALSSEGFEAEQISDYKGLGKQAPFIALLLLFVLISLIGIPPTIGFYAKLIVLDALINADLTWLAIVAVLFTVIGAFYYLRVIRVMYFETASATTPIPDKISVAGMALLSLNGLFILGLGLYPTPLINLCLSVFK